MSKNKFIGKIKHVDNDIIYVTKSKKGHHAYISAYNKRNHRVAVNLITSVTDSKGNIKPNTANQIQNGLVLVINRKYANFNRLSGIKKETYAYNIKANRPLVISDLKDDKKGYSISKSNIPKIQKFIFNQPKKLGLSLKNRKTAKLR